MPIFRIGIDGAGVVPIGAMVNPAVAAAGGNGLLNNLVVYWPGDEASGDLIDAHTGGIDLSDQNTVTNDTGLVYPTARKYTRANSEYHVSANGDDLSPQGDNDYTLATWIRCSTFPASEPAAQHMVGKWELIGDNTHADYAIMHYYTPTVMPAANGVWWVVHNATFAPIAEVGPFVWSAGTWYLFVCWHDAVNDVAKMLINDTWLFSSATSGPSGDGDGRFTIGRFMQFDPGSAYLDGRVGPTMFWRSAPGGGGVLTDAQRTALYNGGAGLPYSEFTT